MTALCRLDRAVGMVLRAVPTACLAALFALLLVNVAARTLQFSGFAWFDEVVQGLFAWMVFVGAAALWRERDHFQLDWLPGSLPPAQARLVRILICLLGIAFLVAMTWYGATLTLKARALTPILDLPTALFYVAIPLSGATMLAYSLADLSSLLFRSSPQKDPA
ncbi:TRAP transporter small permease [Geminicoccus roseus]|uniref:TRAP transporter small permease n=1 Tax=Geminicoccus roseus TaxID=404900 RepID=UPI0003F5A279|nr:TRAP transporter small permease [Geminicoccus roseus]